MIDDPDFDARWDRDMKAQLAALRADEILAALRRLDRDWRAYQRRFKPAAAGQLDLFTDAAMMAERHATIHQRPDAAVEGGAGDPTPPRRYPR
jgi:hypothetical protein